MLVCKAPTFQEESETLTWNGGTELPFSLAADSGAHTHACPGLPQKYSRPWLVLGGWGPRLPRGERSGWGSVQTAKAPGRQQVRNSQGAMSSRVTASEPPTLYCPISLTHLARKRPLGKPAAGDSGSSQPTSLRPRRAHTHGLAPHPCPEGLCKASNARLPSHPRAR